MNKPFTPFPFPVQLSIVLLLLFYSCDYKPKGDYLNDQNPIPPSGVSITIMGHSDTLIANYNDSYQVQVICENRKLIFYRLYINNVRKNNTEVSGSPFSIDPLSYIQADGVYEMGVEICINTGSGSIGDALGSEGYLCRKNFILVVMREPNSFSPDIKFERANGSMKLILDVPSNVTNVRKVTFFKTEGNSQPTLFANVIGNNHYTALDPTYVGEYANYKVQTYVGDPAGKIFVPFVTGYGYASSDLPDIYAGASGRGYPLLSWNKTHYTANVGSYRIYGRISGSTNSELLGTVSNLNDTAFEAASSTFPAYYTFHVAAVPAQLPSWFNDDIAWNLFSKEIGTYVGQNSFFYDRFLTPSGSYVYYSTSSNDIEEYSVETNTITNQINTSVGWFYTYAVSPNRKYLLAATGVSDFSYLFYDLTTEQTYWIPSSAVIGIGASTGIISVADNGIGSITTGNKIVIYDFLHNALITQQLFPLNAARTVISADGQYILAEASILYLYKLVSGSLKQKWTSSGSSGTIKYYTFDPTQPSKAKILIDQTYYTRNGDNGSTEGSFALPIDNICNIDFTYGHILGYTATQFMVFDPSSGSLQYQHNTDPSSTRTDLRIKKNTLYHSSGKKLILF